jgi:hypothetical protein
MDRGPIITPSPSTMFPSSPCSTPGMMPGGIPSGLPGGIPIAPQPRLVPEPQAQARPYNP